jgi:hypothetical protein
MKRTALVRLLPLLLLLAPAPATAKNVDLVTLPQRDTVQLTIYNSEDITLVKETRSVTVKKGANQLQFSWAGTLIDPTSVEFRTLEHQDDIAVVDTVFPGQKPQHLLWNIDSKFEGQVRVEVSYFTSGLTWSMDYVSIVDPAEEKMQFRGYVRVFNRSGEEYENAEVRLIVGTINLVEKIAELAQRDGRTPPTKGGKAYFEYSLLAIRGDMKKAEDAAREADNGELLGREKQIVKEGLSEYFMFSVPGTETINNGWSKRMVAVTADDAKFDIVYRMRAYQYGPRPVRFFVWRNDAEHKLGDSPLPDGRVRVFRDNGQDGLAFLGQEQVRYVPIKAEIEVNLGPDDLVVYETRRTVTKRLNFHFTWVGDRECVDGWDERTDWIDTIKNYRTKPIAFELRRQWTGDVDYESEVATTLYDYQTIEAKFSVPQRGKFPYPCTATTHQGANAKQVRVNLK